MKINADPHGPNQNLKQFKENETSLTDRINVLSNTINADKEIDASNTINQLSNWHNYGYDKWYN